MAWIKLGSTKVASARDEGWNAGYRDEPRESNPYRKGTIGGNAEVECTASLWDVGYLQGQRDAREDLHEKRLSPTR
jgi:hypothetical protein